MPPNQDDKSRDGPAPDEDEISLIMQTLNATPLDFSSISTESEYSLDGLQSPSIYETVELPQEPTLKELVQRATGRDDVSDVTKVKLLVIACDVSLQHLSFHTPALKELILDGSVLSSLRDLGCGLRNLKMLSVNRCGLSTLDGTFGLENLEELHAAKNKLPDLIPCCNLPFIKKINASDNSITNIDTVYFLTLCENLTEISLEGNPEITSVENYRIVVKKLIPKLTILDGITFTEEETREAQPKEKRPSLSTSKFLPQVTDKVKSNEQGENAFVVTFPPKILSQQKTLSPDVTSRASNKSNQDATNRTLPDIVINRQGSAKF